MAAVLDFSMSHDRSTLSPGIPEGTRRASEGMPGAAARPDPEVVAVARRRRFSAGEKRVLLVEADRCKAADRVARAPKKAWTEARPVSPADRAAQGWALR